ncbi:hypothetical protein [Streptomyces sp. NPDC088785]|uniref:hypothetical protein n=1 Tax=Streptomyces sp. NPDC088785 TaxID=3365897 RepID=UPI003823E2B0
MEVVERLVRGRPGRHLSAASAGAGLTVVGRRAGALRLGATARSVVRHAASPVALVPHS